MLTREEIIDHMASALRDEPLILGAWLGGSDSTGRADARSDIDLMLVVEAGKIEECASIVEAAVQRLTPIRLKYRMPFPNTFNCHQSFYQLEGAPEDLMIDWLMVERGQEHPWFEVERHGEPAVLFDKLGVIRGTHVDLEDLREKRAAKLPDLRTKYLLYRHIPIKCAERGLPIDAMSFYYSLVMRPIVDLARCVHCLERFDFGWRYLQDDLPAELHDRIAKLAYPQSMESIPECCRKADALMHELFEQAEGQGLL